MEGSILGESQKVYNFGYLKIVFDMNTLNISTNFKQIFFHFDCLVENLEHCDFIALRNMVIRTHLQDLKDVTNNVHYENFRCRTLAGVGVDGKPTKVSNK